jgi:DNA-directed RNA polymerase subunit RPC12/RpoP
MDLMTLFSESDPCEVPAHDEQPHYHAGDGEWYLISDPCIYCDDSEREVVLICNRFKESLEMSMEDGNVPCNHCGRRLMIKDMNLRFEKKGTS